MSEELRRALEVAAGRLAWASQASPGCSTKEGRALVAGWAQEARDALALIDHLEADGGVEAMREAIDAGLKSFVRDQPDFDMSRRMRQDAIDHIIAQPGLYSALPVLGVGR